MTLGKALKRVIADQDDFQIIKIYDMTNDGFGPNDVIGVIVEARENPDHFYAPIELSDAPSAILVYTGDFTSEIEQSFLEKSVSDFDPAIVSK